MVNDDALVWFLAKESSEELARDVEEPQPRPCLEPAEQTEPDPEIPF